MFILDYFKGILNYLGLSKKSAKILFLGLDNAGVIDMILLENNINA